MDISQKTMEGDIIVSESGKMMIFSWNHQAVRIGDSIKETESRDWSLAQIYESYPPDFFPHIENIIKHHNPDVVVFGSQEDAIPGSYFHSDFLPKKMADLYYNLQKRTRLMGLGIETYKAIKTFDFKLRGLRLSIYTKPHLTGVIELEERGMRDFLGEKGQLWANCSFPILQSKGGVASYLKIPGMDPIVFICAHLPFDAESIKQAFLQHNPEVRKKAVNYSNLSFNYLLQELIFNVKLEGLYADNGDALTSLDVGHVFFFGDLNYRVFSLERNLEERFMDDSEENLKDIYVSYDELYKELRDGRILLDFQEGINNQGPLFLPTCKMAKPRKSHKMSDKIEDIFNIGSGQRKPSWCDRILYCDRKDTLHHTTCIEYDRLDEGDTMKKSDHAAIYGVYEFERR